MLVRHFSLATLTAAALMAATTSLTPAMAGPVYVFSVSVGTQPADVGVITITQDGANSVIVGVDLKDGYGFLNTGGPHTPFAFNLQGSGTPIISAFTTPTNGEYQVGSSTYTLTLNTLGGANTPYGEYGVAIDSDAGNGSGKAYYGDLLFTLSRTGGLSTDDFIANTDGYFFSADLTNGRNTGAQAWNTPGTPTTTIVPEPATLALFGLGLVGLGAVLSRKRHA